MSRSGVLGGTHATLLQGGKSSHSVAACYREFLLHIIRFYMTFFNVWVENSMLPLSHH